jgi:hypothetical protein
MKLPNSEQATVPQEKLTDYLLSLTHPVGRSKAVYFRSLGYDETNTSQLIEALLGIAKGNDVRDTIETGYGIKYTVLGELTTPTKQTAQIITVWIVDKGQTVPRFVTAYPFDEEEE